MSADKFNFQIRSRIGAGIYGGNRFFSAYCRNAGHAETLATLLTPCLANYCGVGVSKQIIEIPNIELPESPEVTNTYLYRFLLCSEATSGNRFTIDLPLSPNCDVNGVVDDLNYYLCDRAANRVKVLSARVIVQNIVRGGDE